MMWEGVNIRCARIHGLISWKGYVRTHVDRSYARLQSNCYVAIFQELYVGRVGHWSSAPLLLWPIVRDVLFRPPFAKRQRTEEQH